MVPRLTGLDQIWAKSPRRDEVSGEPLLDHLSLTCDALGRIEGRLGSGYDLDWPVLAVAALVHDAGKVAADFQAMLRVPNRGITFLRHEIMSLLLVWDLYGGDPDLAVRIGTPVLAHHRFIHALDGAEEWTVGGIRSEVFSEAISCHLDQRHPAAPLDWNYVGIAAAHHRSLLDAIHLELQARRLPDPVPPVGDHRPGHERCFDLYQRVIDATERPRKVRRGAPCSTEGLRDLLGLGAVTWADHLASAHVELDAPGLPLSTDLLDIHGGGAPHQRQAMAVGARGRNLLLIAPTGSGKTDGLLAYTAAIAPSLPGGGRMVYTLPYRASINAMHGRLVERLGVTPDDVGLVHSSSASSLAAAAAAANEDARSIDVTDARKARARDRAGRLFRQPVRVTTAYQILMGLIGGARYSSNLLDQVGSVLCLDELHAYSPKTFGRLIHHLSVLTQAGAKIAVATATLAPPHQDMLSEALGGDGRVETVTAPAGTAPQRHVLHADEQEITDPASLNRIKGWIQEGHAVLVGCNRVGTARQVFEALRPAVTRRWPDDPNAMILYHSRFTGADRQRIEGEILRRYPERSRTDRHHGRVGGLVVATQTINVSLTVDFDRGAKENGLPEDVAQWLGRVNRVGRHPDSVVPAVVHRCSRHPYTSLTGRNGELLDPVEAAWQALRTALPEAFTVGATVTEDDLDLWLATSYQSPWGQAWIAEAKRAAQTLREAPVGRLSHPWHLLPEAWDEIGEAFGGADVVLDEHWDRYLDACDQDLILGDQWVIPISDNQFAALYRDGCIEAPTTMSKGRRKQQVWHVTGGHRYDPARGFDLASAEQPDDII